MRRVNVDRMRRHMARTEPDLRRWRFTRSEMAAADVTVSEHLDHWAALMSRKHGDRGQHPEVTVWRDEFGGAVVEAKVTP